MVEMPDHWGPEGAWLAGGLINTLWRVGDVVVRWSADRPGVEVRAEQEFVRHLAAHDVAVAEPVRARDGRWLVPWKGGSATGWRWVPGASPTSVDGQLAGQWGRHLARMHDASSSWQGARPSWRRDRWWRDCEALLAHDPELTAHARQVLDGVGEGPACHADHGPQNFHIHRGRIVSFDFDNACFQPVELDLAVPLSLLQRAPEPALAEEAFLHGYTDVRPLPEGFVAARRRWLAVRQLLVHLSRLALWPAPDEQQQAWLQAHRSRVLS